MSLEPQSLVDLLRHLTVELEHSDMFRVLITGSSIYWLELSLSDDTEHQLLTTSKVVTF